MHQAEYSVVRAACAYFFICPGLAYSVLTSRMPALKMQTGADEAEIGLLLLCLGLSSLVALFCSSRVIARWGSARVLKASSLTLPLVVALCCLAQTPLQLGVGCLMTGMSMALMDVSINTQGIQIERRYRSRCMSFMHAAYSFGGVAGSLSGALFAALGQSPFVNAVCVLGLYSFFRLWASRHLLDDLPESSPGRKKASGSLPFFVILCGVLSMLAYAAEGSVAEWGSLLLFTVKGAGEETAALVFAAFSLTTVFCRLLGDRLRRGMGNFPLLLSGSLLAFCGMLLVLWSASAALCLVGYALMGAGLSPLVPLFFSRAGSVPGISAGRASAVVSLLSYSGLLLFPPSLGFVARDRGLSDALLIVLAACLCLTAGSVFFRDGKKS